MKNTMGTALSVTIFGESHGPMLGAVLDGLPAGIPVDGDVIAAQLALRRPTDGLSTSRREDDPFEIVSGVCRGFTCGTPLCILIPNRAQSSEEYEAIKTLARPGHADYAAQMKYGGFQDTRGGGHFSGRITAALVAAGAVVLPALRRKNIVIRSHILRCGGESDRRFSLREEELRGELASLENMAFPVLSREAGERMKRAILAAKEAGDSVGGVLETAVCGIPAGVGEPWFDGAENVLARALYAIPAVKGVAFGDGFSLADMRGSQANDPYYMEDGRVRTASNHNGGINGGVTNGMPLVIQTAIKPTPSIGQPQKTVDFVRGEDTTLTLRGRHDPCIVHRAAVAVDSAAALALCDLLMGRFGAGWLTE